MNINPQDKERLTKFTLAAKKIIYDPERMKTFMQMLGSKQGAVQAVHTVVAAIDKIQPIPPQIKPLLGVNTYMLMVDVAQEATGATPDPAILKEVIGVILNEAGMLPQMQEQGEPAGDPEMPDNTAEHESVEPAALETQEGAEEDGVADDPQMAAELAALRQRRGG